MTGCTVHVATVDMDAGPILAQEEVAVRPDDTAATLHERIKEVERRLYPATIWSVLQACAEESTQSAGDGARDTRLLEKGRPTS